MVGILGDIDNNTVEFNEPINVHDNYLDKAKTFDEGNTRYERFDYLGTLSKGKLGVMDHACLHRTLVKDNSKPRLSMDIAVMVDSEYSHANGDGFDPNAYSYYDAQDLQLVGDINHYSVKESIKDTTPSTTISLQSIIAC